MCYFFKFGKDKYSRYVYKRMYVFRFYDLSYYLNNCKFGDVSIYNNLDIRFVLKIISFKVISLFI